MLQSGIGGVVKASLYKPLAKQDGEKISKIIITTEKFFKKIGILTIVYTIILAITLPILNEEFDFIYSFLLVIVIGTRSFWTILFWYNVPDDIRSRSKRVYIFCDTNYYDNY